MVVLTKKQTIKDFLKDLYSNQKSVMAHFFDFFEEEELEPIVKDILLCKGEVLFSGVGKSGFIARKISSTLRSIGQKSSFLSVEDALHGDIGTIQDDDIVIFFSKSGETEEILQLVDVLKNKKVKIIVFTSNKKSRLALHSDTLIFLPLVRELCPFDLVPTMSTITQQLIGDLLVISVMKAKNIVLSNYSLNHPKGRIGKRSSLKVEKIMLSLDQLPLCNENDSLQEVLQIFSERKLGCLLIISDRCLLKGIFTDGDLRRALQKFEGRVLSMSMKDLMIKNPRVILKSDLAWHALLKMETPAPVTILPVVSSEEERKILGLISVHDLISKGI